LEAQLPITLKVRAPEDSARRTREAAAQKVIAQFRAQASEARLLCLLDDEDWQALKQEVGIANRGAFLHLRGPLPWLLEAPGYVQELLLVGGQFAFDDFIYMHGSTCSDALSLTLTLAHELQHFVQHESAVSLWAANSLVPILPNRVIATLGLTWCDIPHEREARIVPKRIAEGLFGAERTDQHIQTKIRERVTEADAADWECIRKLNASARYDLATETSLLFARLKPYRMDLENALQSFKVYSDFGSVDLDTLMGGAQE
jgi:hypothetical protein